MDDEWVVEDYRPDAGGRQVVRGGPDPAVYRTRPPSLAIHADEKSPACLVSPWVRVLPNTPYSVMGWVRTRDLRASGRPRGTLLLDERSETGVVHHAFTDRDGTTEGWEPELLSFTTGRQADMVRLSACVAGADGGTGSAWFDDVALVRERGDRLDAETAARLAETVLSFPWRYDVVEATRIPLGRDAIWDDDDPQGALRRKVDLGGDIRNALPAPIPSWYRLRMEQTEETRLRLAFGMADLQGAQVDGELTFHVGIEPDGGDPRHLLGHTLRPAAGEAGRWHEVELLLPRGPADLVLGTESTPDLRLAAAAFANPTLLPPATSKGRLVLLISVDTLRADALGVYGAARPTSPRLDALASRGVVFEWAFSPSPWTLPSHRTLLTGLQPLSHGSVIAQRHRLRSDLTTLGEHLQREGFATVGIHGGGFVSPAYGFAEGFDRFVEIPEARDAVDEAIRVVDARRDQDLFLFLHNYHVHSPYREDLPSLDALGPRYRELRAELGDAVDPNELGAHDHLFRQNAAKAPLSGPKLEMVELLYQAGVRAIDGQLGRLLDALEQGGRLDEAVIVVTSDHGEAFGEHGLFLHSNTVYAEELRVPLLVIGPDVPAGRRVETTVGSADVLPTMLELLGVPVPEGLEGRSLVGAWNPEAGATPARVSGSHLSDRSAQLYAIDGETKYIVGGPQPREELFDLAQDRADLDDVAAARPERIDAHRQAVFQRLASLPGLNVAARGGDGSQRLIGRVYTPGGRPIVRVVFPVCPDCLQVDDEGIALDLPLDAAPLWINLPQVDAEAARIELSLDDEPLQLGSAQDLLETEGPGAFVFTSGGEALEAAPLSPDRLQQLEALGYLE